MPRLGVDPQAYFMACGLLFDTVGALRVDELGELLPLSGCQQTSFPFAWHAVCPSLGMGRHATSGERATWERHRYLSATCRPIAAKCHIFSRRARGSSR